MLSVRALLLELWIPLLLLWVASTVVAALAVERVAQADLDDDERMGREAWLCFAAAGAAAGGLVGTMVLVRDLLLGSSTEGDLLRLVRVVTPGMLMGGVFACLLAAVVVQHGRR